MRGIKSAKEWLMSDFFKGLMKPPIPLLKGWKIIVRYDDRLCIHNVHLFGFDCKECEDLIERGINSKMLEKG